MIGSPSIVRATISPAGIWCVHPATYHKFRTNIVSSLPGRGPRRKTPRNPSVVIRRYEEMVVKSTTSAAHFANLRSRTRLLTLFWRVAAQGISANGMKTLRNRSKVPALKSRNYHDRIPYLLGAISNILSAGGSRLYRRAFGIGLAEGRLIWVLGYESPLTAQRASQIMGVDKGATSRALAGLERRGLVHVTVDRSDGRQRVIEFSASGRTLLERIMVVSQERERRLR